MQNETWEKEFDERFHRVGMDTNFGFTDGLDGYEQLKSFIRSLLSSHDAELARKIEKFIDENDDGMWAGRETADHILSLISSKRMK